MNKKFGFSILIVFILISFGCTLSQNNLNTISNTSETTSQVQVQAISDTQDEQSSSEGSLPVRAQVTGPGEMLTTYVNSEGIGSIAVQVAVPQEPRYSEGAGIVVEVNTFLTRGNTFYSSVDAAAIGLFQVSYLWPGMAAQGASSDGVFDYGMENSIQALHDVILFASGEIPNVDGFYLADLVTIRPEYSNVGIYAFSHPGQAAVNVLALYGDELSGVGYFVGRENPTIDKLTAVEVGYFDNNRHPVLNPLYQYPMDYQPTDITIDYSSILWDGSYTESGSNWVGIPYFDLNGNGNLDSADFPLGLRVPAVNGKRVYSAELVSALMANDAFTDLGGWPSDLAPLDLVEELWAFNDSSQRYPEIGRLLPGLKVMLVFAQFDHVQPASDKPHIHQAFDGFFHGARLWVRLNPDQTYVAWANPGLGRNYQEHDANQEPSDWLTIDSWGHTNIGGAAQLVPLAAIAEMADRTQADIWDADLDGLLFEFSFQQGQ
jgi:hypothetical protein